MWITALFVLLFVDLTNSISGNCSEGLYPNDEKCLSYQYGPDPIQVLDCHFPAARYSSPVVLLVHGGYWNSIYNRSIESMVGNDLLRHHLVVCALDYRSVGNAGGYPNTFYDVSNGTDLLRSIAQEEGFSSDRVIIVGHSAGGQLGGFLSGRFRLRPGQPGYSADPLRPLAFATQAGVNNMWDGCDQWRETGDGAVIKFLGGRYDESPQRYIDASLAASSHPKISQLYPSAYLPLGIPIQAITGLADVTVPVDQTLGLTRQALAAGDRCSEVLIAGEDHFAHLDPSSKCWNSTVTFILSFRSVLF